MNSNVMSNDSEMVEQTNGIYGSNRVDYMLFVIGMCGNEKTYGVGNLEENQHRQVTYDVTQKFPADEFAAALKATQTDIAQVQGAPSEFNYTQYPTGVEFILSKMTGVNATNIGAGIIKNLLKKYDSQSYLGAGGNTGVVDNPKGIETSKVWSTDFDTFKVALDEAVIRLRDATDITSSQYANVQVGYSKNINTILTQVDNYNVSNMEKLQKAYPNMMFEEMPSALEPTADVFTVCYRPMLTFHRGALPSVNAQEAGKYGKSTDTLYAYESMAVEVEETGALQRVTLTTS